MTREIDYPPVPLPAAALRTIDAIGRCIPGSGSLILARATRLP